MASIRKKSLKPKADGSRAIRWLVDWYSPDGRRFERSFKTKRAAERFRAERVIDPEAIESRTVLEAGRAYLEHFESAVIRGERRQSTLEQKRQHVELHLAPRALGALKAGEAKPKDFQAFLDALVLDGVSYALARKIAITLRQVWKWCAVRGWQIQNDAAQFAGVIAPRSRRSAEPVEIPSKEACAAMLAAADARAPIDRGRAAALFRVIMLAGLRAGEARALTWSDVRLDADAPSLTIRRSADRYLKIHDRPKTDAGRRRVPISPKTVAALKAWKLAAPKSALDLVFPSEAGGVWRMEGLYRNCWSAVMRDADLAERNRPEPPAGRSGPARDKGPAADWTPRYGPKTARHVAASLWIAGGASPKWIKDKMGHETYKLSMELYGHLWPDSEEDQRIAAGIDQAF